MARNLRRDIFTKVDSFSNSEFDKFSVSSLIHPFDQRRYPASNADRHYDPHGDLRTYSGYRRYHQGRQHRCLDVVDDCAGGGALLTSSLATFSVALPKFKIIQKLTDRLNLVTRENLSGMMVIRAFNTQKFEEKRFDKANTDLTDTNLFVNRVMAMMMPFMMLIMNGVRPSSSSGSARTKWLSRRCRSVT